MSVDAADEFQLKNAFSIRPNAGKGLWVMLLLPTVLITSFVRHSIVTTPTYKLVTLISVGLLCTSLVIILRCKRNERLERLDVWTIIIAISTGCLFNVCLHKGWLFALASGIFASIIYVKIYNFLLTTFKTSFSYGEAGLIAQGLVIFIYTTLENTIRQASQNVVPKNNMQVSTLIIQMGLLGILLLIYTIYQFNITNPMWFYITSISIVVLTILLPLDILIGQCPLIWIFNRVFNEIALLKLMIYWSFCCGIAVLAVSNQIVYAKKASTSTRKIFHILAVSVYIPGLLYKCSFLYLATGVVLGIFFVLEIMRIQAIPPLGRQLQDGYIVFKDDKDTGILSLTPIYLLVGCSLPIWVHPAPCDVTDSSLFNILPLISGLLTIGIGDTAASFIGSNYGKFKWKRSHKTVEGTVACILSQLGFIYLLCYLEFVPHLNSEQTIRILAGVLVTSVVEAKTTQVDNLVLPLLMYLFLI